MANCPLECLRALCEMNVGFAHCTYRVGGVRGFCPPGLVVVAKIPFINQEKRNKIVESSTATHCASSITNGALFCSEKIITRIIFLKSAKKCSLSF